MVRERDLQGKGPGSIDSRWRISFFFFFSEETLPIMVKYFKISSKISKVLRKGQRPSTKGKFAASKPFSYCFHAEIRAVIFALGSNRRIPGQ